ncbi:hypothetical protein LCGC14_0364900 [marine sediment metagenome]|uniref:Uncharacterized protein n=1 Tax=marine sediment metagenome TaxID=412755 RepID=A0A0F9WFE0_9ZZZZ
MSGKSEKKLKRKNKKLYSYSHINFLLEAKHWRWKQRFGIAWQFLWAIDPYKKMTKHNKEKVKHELKKETKQ